MVGEAFLACPILEGEMMSLSEQRQRIVQEYIDSGQSWPASSNDIAAWAISNRRWQAQNATLINQCAREISQAMREEYVTDAQGRSVRAKHAMRTIRSGQQISLWADIRTAKRDHMHVAFQQRRQHIFGECRQLKTDVDSYNDNINIGEPIQMIFDFTLDLEEVIAVAA